MSHEKETVDFLRAIANAIERGQLRPLESEFGVDYGNMDLRGLDSAFVRRIPTGMDTFTLKVKCSVMHGRADDFQPTRAALTSDRLRLSHEGNDGTDKER